MTDNKKLFCVCCSGNYSMSFGWDSGWNNMTVYPCSLDGNNATFTVRDREYTCKLNSDFIANWGGFVDDLKDNAGSRSADVYVFADNVDDAKTKAHDVIMRFWPPSAFYIKEK